MSLAVDLNRMGKVVDEFAPEVTKAWDVIDDPSEEKLGRLHENRILGIKLRYLFLDQPRTTTSDIEDSYELFFQKIARSTVSTYLNQLDKEGVLHKERDGRVVYYLFSYEPPSRVNPFWFVRNICTTPAYLARASYFASLFEEVSKEHGSDKTNKRYLVGVVFLSLLLHRLEKCVLCQFGTRSIYRKLRDQLSTALDDRKDVLPKQLSTYLVDDLGEIPVFGGVPLPQNKERIREDLDKYSIQYAQDLEFQMMVSERRQEVRLKQISKA
ncbi:MAG: hypothetical protein ACTSU5_07325 [Promethearchaeota archaeon]